jgi:hypothetical protein
VSEEKEGERAAGSAVMSITAPEDACIVEWL